MDDITSAWNGPLFQKKRGKRRWLGWLITGGILLIALTAVTVYLEKTKYSFRRQMRELGKTLSENEKSIHSIESVIILRARHYNQRFFLDYRHQYSYALANFIRKLSLSRSEGMEFTGLKIEPGPQIFQFVLSGLLHSPLGEQGRAQLAQFLESLKGLTEVVQVLSPEVQVKADTREKEIVLVFAVRGSAELE